jgi:hypothetical protein
MKIFCFLFVSILSLIYILKFADCAENYDLVEIRPKEVKRSSPFQSLFKKLLKSSPGTEKLTSYFTIDSQRNARKTLAFILLLSISQRDPRILISQLSSTYEENNKQFNDFMDQSMCQEWDKIDNGKLTLKSFLLNQSLKEFIVNSEGYSIVWPIIKEIQAWAKILCRKKFKWITDFLNKEASIAEFDCTLKEFELFDTLVSKIIWDASEAKMFCDNSISSIISFLGSSKAQIISDLKEKGLFFILANYLNEEGVQKLVRILDSRIRVQLNLREKEIERLGRFWSSLYILKDVDSIGFLGFILLKFSFNQKCRENGFFSEIRKSEEAFMDRMFGASILSKWQMEFNGVFSPTFMPPYEVNVWLRDFGLSKDEFAHCIFGRVIYNSFFGGIIFKTAFSHITPVGVFSGSYEILGLEDKNLEELSQLECVADVYCTLSIRNEYSKHRSAIYRFFFQHVAAYKSERKADLFEKALESMGDDLKVSSKEPGKNSLKIWEVQNIMYTIANAYMGEDTITLKHAEILAKLEENAQTSVIAWLKKLYPTDHVVNFEKLIGKPECIYNVLKTLCPDKK